MSAGDHVRVPPRPPDPHHDRERVAPLPPPFEEVVARFNAGEYRACVEPLEGLFFADRNTFYQGLLHLTVALLQLRLGMVRGPRIRLASAAELLAPYAPWHRGVDVAALMAESIACRARLPADVVQVSVAEIEQWGLPIPRLRREPRSAPDNKETMTNQNRFDDGECAPAKECRCEG